MNWDRIEGNWKQFRGQVQQQWGKLTNDDLDTVEGRRVELVGKIQERYGIAKDEAEKQVDSWIAQYVAQVPTRAACFSHHERPCGASLVIWISDEAWASSRLIRGAPRHWSRLGG